MNKLKNKFQLNELNTLQELLRKRDDLKPYFNYGRFYTFIVGGLNGMHLNLNITQKEFKHISKIKAPIRKNIIRVDLSNNTLLLLSYHIYKNTKNYFYPEWKELSNGKYEACINSPHIEYKNIKALPNRDLVVIDGYSTDLHYKAVKMCLTDLINSDVPIEWMINAIDEIKEAIKKGL